MAIPNLIALIALSGVVATETNEYLKERKCRKQQNIKITDTNTLE